MEEGAISKEKIEVLGLAERAKFNKIADQAAARDTQDTVQIKIDEKTSKKDLTMMFAQILNMEYKSKAILKPPLPVNWWNR